MLTFKTAPKINFGAKLPHAVSRLREALNLLNYIIL